MAGETMMHNLVSPVVCLYGVSQTTLVVGGTLWERFGCAGGTWGVWEVGAASAFHPTVTLECHAAGLLPKPSGAGHTAPTPSLGWTDPPQASWLLGLLQTALA